jgi:hypothetical protein
MVTIFLLIMLLEIQPLQQPQLQLSHFWEMLDLGVE